MGFLVKQCPCDLVRIHPPQLRPHSHMQVPPKREHMLIVHQLPTKGVQVPPKREPTMPVRCGQTKPDGLRHIDTVDSDLIHHQYRLSVLQWNPGPGPARRTPTNIIAAACGRFHTVILQEASDHVPDITDQFIAYGSAHRSRPSASPFSFRYSDGHILLCTHPHCSGQET